MSDYKTIFETNQEIKETLETRHDLCQQTLKLLKEYIKSTKISFRNYVKAEKAAAEELAKQTKFFSPDGISETVNMDAKNEGSVIL